MAQKPENTFRNSVNRHLPIYVYQVKMSNMYNSGIPDDWYSGDKSITGESSDLWIEYKFLPKIPLRATVCMANPNQKYLSKIQLNWLNQRYREGRNVAVVCGTPDGGVIMCDQEWLRDFTPQEFRDRIKPRKEIAQWIAQLTTR